MRFFLLLASVLAVGALHDGALAQIQPGGATLGTSVQPESAQDVKLKTAACNKAANKYKLRDPDRKQYLDRCVSMRYFKGFKPPNWPLT